MPGLVGPNGLPISSAQLQAQTTSSHKKASSPPLGPAFGDWAGRDASWNQLPGSAILQFDLSQLTLADFRAMKYHPQINASLSVLTFMLHQIDWSIECEDQKIADFVDEVMRDMWTRLIRAMSQSFWAGYSPTVIEWDNDLVNKKVVITKFKDLIPEECEVNWKLVPAWAPPGEIPQKLKVYDGIKVRGAKYPIPPDCTIWYPLLMENGNFYGRQLLKAAFSPWYFSVLVHLFANRYYERFGEPVPIGRAPFDDELPDGNGGVITAKEAMENILMSLRSRSVVTLPSDRDPVTKEFDYTLDYLESQMRGADFERYLARLDEEMSLAIFTPMLLMRTGDVGSNNLGVQHTQTYLWMLNALAGDMKEYIDRYVCERLKAINFSSKAPKVQWVPKKLGKESVETIRSIITQLISNNQATVDLEQLGVSLGMTVKEVHDVLSDDPNAGGTDTRDRGERVRKSPKKGVGEPRATGREVAARLRPQVEKAFRDKNLDSTFRPSLGYERRMTEAFRLEGHEGPEDLTTKLYKRLNQWIEQASGLGANEYSGPQDFMAMFDRCLDSELDALV